MTDGVVEGRLRALGLTLPRPVKPIGSFAPAVQTGNLVFVSGQGPEHDGDLPLLGRVDSDVALADAVAAARRAALNCLAVHSRSGSGTWIA